MASPELAVEGSPPEIAPEVEMFRRVDSVFSNLLMWCRKVAGNSGALSSLLDGGMDWASEECEELFLEVALSAFIKRNHAIEKDQITSSLLSWFEKTCDPFGVEVNGVDSLRDGMGICCTISALDDAFDFEKHKGPLLPYGWKYLLTQEGREAREEGGDEERERRVALVGVVLCYLGSWRLKEWQMSVSFDFSGKTQTQEEKKAARRTKITGDIILTQMSASKMNDVSTSIESVNIEEEPSEGFDIVISDGEDEDGFVVNFEDDDDQLAVEVEKEEELEKVMKKLNRKSCSIRSSQGLVFTNESLMGLGEGGEGEGGEEGLELSGGGGEVGGKGKKEGGVFEKLSFEVKYSATVVKVGEEVAVEVTAHNLPKDFTTLPTKDIVVIVQQPRKKKAENGAKGGKVEKYTAELTEGKESYKISFPCSVAGVYKVQVKYIHPLQSKRCRIRAMTKKRNMTKKEGGSDKKTKEGRTRSRTAAANPNPSKNTNEWGNQGKKVPDSPLGLAPPPPPLPAPSPRAQEKWLEGRDGDEGGEEGGDGKGKEGKGDRGVFLESADWERMGDEMEESEDVLEIQEEGEQNRKMKRKSMSFKSGNSMSFKNVCKPTTPPLSAKSQLSSATLPPPLTSSTDSLPNSLSELPPRSPSLGGNEELPHSPSDPSIPLMGSVRRRGTLRQDMADLKPKFLLSRVNLAITYPRRSFLVGETILSIITLFDSKTGRAVPLYDNWKLEMKVDLPDGKVDTVQCQTDQTTQIIYGSYVTLEPGSYRAQILFNAYPVQNKRCRLQASRLSLMSPLNLKTDKSKKTKSDREILDEIKARRAKKEKKEKGKEKEEHPVSPKLTGEGRGPGGGGRKRGGTNAGEREGEIREMRRLMEQELGHTVRVGGGQTPNKGEEKEGGSGKGGKPRKLTVQEEIEQKRELMAKALGEDVQVQQVAIEDF